MYRTSYYGSGCCGYNSCVGVQQHAAVCIAMYLLKAKWSTKQQLLSQQAFIRRNVRYL
jgi:hypothetical protein